jgi:hypothetical protein
MEHAILKEAKQMLTKNCEKYLFGRADDFERIYMQTEPSLASTSTSNALDKHGPSRELVFYIGAAFEITFNDVDSKFFKGQLCIVLDLPDKDDLLTFKSIKLLRAPPGTDTLPPTVYDKNDLIGQGWEEVFIRKERPDKH